MEVTDHRTKKDFANCMKNLVDVHLPNADLIQIVIDNLNIHTPAALYETFEATEARRILKKLEFHYTPKHGSWLNQVEIELSVLSRQCLERRIADQQTLKREIAAWEEPRNVGRVKVEWRFTSETARKKLKRLYPLQLSGVDSSEASGTKLVNMAATFYGNHEQ